MLIAYVSALSMKHDRKTVRWRRFDDREAAEDWMVQTYWDLVAVDRTSTGLITYGILYPENEETQ